MGRRLRGFLARVFVLGVGATQAGCCCPGPDPDLDIKYDRSDFEISGLIDRCFANPEECVQLCRIALKEEFGSDAFYYEVTDCRVTPRADGMEGAHVHVAYWDGSACGRAPDGLIDCPIDHRDPVTRWLARAAYLEAASVVAFVHLAADLVRHGAPRPLIAAAIAAAKDEIRHAAMVRALVGAVPVPRVPAYRRASLYELALLNAVEGCARESVGAVVNAWQARCADVKLRDVFAAIAPDEQRHAQLSWAIHAWVLPRLDAVDARTVHDAHRAALASLAEPGVDAATRSFLGLPSDRELAAIARAFDTRRRDRPTRRAPGRSS